MDVSNYNNSMSKCTVYPIFPSVVGSFTNTDNLSELNSIINYEFTTNKSYDNHFITKNSKILDSFPHLKQYLHALFLGFAKEVLKYSNTEFAITRSWGTKVLPGARSYTHVHKNSFYSGVVYWQDFQGSSIEFERFDHSQWLVVPDEWTIYNSEAFSLDHAANTVIFFPSYLAHKINTNTTDQIRYSLAFNVIPVGEFGANDSRVNIILKQD